MDPVRLRRAPAAVLRRPRGARAGAAVPGERHPRPQHPARTPRRRRRALPALRRGLADQRHQPRADRADAGRTRPTAARTLPVYFGNRNWEPYVEDTVAADARQRHSPRGGVHHVGLGRLLELHAVRRGHRPGRAAAGGAARRSWSSCASTSTTRCSSRCSPTGSPPRRRRLPDELRAGARLVFTAHSIPIAADERHGPRPLQQAGGLRDAAGGRGGRLRRLRPGVAVAVRAARRCRGWNPMSATTFRRSPTAAPGR